MLLFLVEGNGGVMGVNVGINSGLHCRYSKGEECEDYRIRWLCVPVTNTD